MLPYSGEPVPVNMRMYFHEWEPGSFDTEGWHVEDDSGALVSTSIIRFPEADGSTVIELIPDAPFDLDQVFVITDDAGTLRFEYAAKFPADEELPVVHAAEIGPTTRSRGDCGLELEARMNYSTGSGRLATMRLYDERTGLYWHDERLYYTDGCGGLPVELWEGPKQFTVIDLAGNESDPLPLTIPAAQCGCAQSPRPQHLGLLGLPPLLWLRRKRRCLEVVPPHVGEEA